MSTFHFQPIKNQARQILSAILKSPEVASCHLKAALSLQLACEEIVMNVTAYAYPEDSDGFLDVDIQKTDRITICFKDGGMPFNPLEQKQPDINQPWEKRRIGGLGILLVLRKMDDIRYAYEDGMNILTIEKVI